VDRRLLCPALAITASLVLVAPAGSAQTANVSVGEYFYRAKTIRIDPGDSVTWTNRGDILHTVTSRRGAPERFGSPNLDAGQAYTRAFPKAGTYDYLCTIHPSLMSGVVQVGPDTVKPTVSGARARAGKKVKVSFSLSERASVVVKVVRKGKAVRSVRKSGLARGARSVTAKLPAAGHYTVSIQATDAAKNRSKTVKTSLDVS
jgi:plastocyanin